jgi:hypothetical protein
MRLFCTISGLESDLPQFTHPAIKQEWKHPIFSLSSAELLRIYKAAWQRQRLSKSESRLLALALFNSSQLVTWVAAVSHTPSSLINQEPQIAQALPLLAEVITFSLSCPSWPQSQLAHFPSIIIDSSNNQDLSIIVTACELWLAAIADYHAGYYRQYQEKRDAEKANFLSHLSAFSSRKPSRYIKALSRYVIDAIPSSQWQDRQEREHMRYIIEYSGLVHTLESKPIAPITSAQCNQLLDIITDCLSLDNLHVWKAYQAVKLMLESGGHNAYGAMMLENQAEQDREQELRQQAIIQLGERPQGFIAAMAYDAEVLRLMATMAATAESHLIDSDSDSDIDSNEA